MLLMQYGDGGLTDMETANGLNNSLLLFKKT